MKAVFEDRSRGRRELRHGLVPLRSLTVEDVQTVDGVSAGWLPDDVASVDEEVDAGHE